jgi:hypothetical protein
MNKLKFRVWDKEQNALVYFDFTDIGKANFLYETSYWYVWGDRPARNPDNPHKYPLDEATKIAGSGVDNPIQQFTGLQDKNGKEIYEGDILEGFDFPVSFEEGCFFVAIAYDLYRIALHELNLNEVEVIGNIFENSELKEKGYYI